MAEARHQVFISSTYTDLMEERAAITAALLRANALPAGMELFPAADDAAWSLIKRVIDESDYFLLVVGGRYGSLDIDGIGFTEKEYDYAVLQKKPIMAFLHKAPGMLPMNANEIDPAARIKLQTFRRKVEAERTVNFWSRADELSVYVLQALSYFKVHYPAPGWSRANDVGSAREWFPTFGSGAPRMTEAIESRLQSRGVQVRWLGVTHEAGWPLIQDLLLRICDGYFGPQASLRATLAVLDPEGIVSKSDQGPDVELIEATIRRVGRFSKSHSEALDRYNSSVSIFTYDVRPSWHALLVDDDLAFYSLCVPKDIDLAAPQGGIEVLRLGREPADDARLRHLADWFAFLNQDGEGSAKAHR